MTKLEELKAAYEASTPGKWETSVLMSEQGPKEWTVCMEGGGDMLADMTNCPGEQANAEFVALAHNLMPVLLEAHEQAAQLEKAMAVIAERGGDYTQNIVNDALHDVGYYSNDDKEA